jgi:hypothetical protein
MCVAGQNLLAAWRHARHADGARLVTIAPPPQVDEHGAAALWANLAGILTPSRRRRLLYGSPHVALQYTWTGRELLISLWVPGTVPADWNGQLVSPLSLGCPISQLTPARCQRSRRSCPRSGGPTVTVWRGSTLPGAMDNRTTAVVLTRPRAQKWAAWTSVRSVCRLTARSTVMACWSLTRP